jgi:hypothetical protein
VLLKAMLFAEWPDFLQMIAKCSRNVLHHSEFAITLTECPLLGKFGKHILT